MNSKKKLLILIFGIVGLLFIIIIGIGGKIYMDKKAEHQAQQEQLKKNLAESKKEIVKLLEWNYKDIQSVTFDYDGSGGSGEIRVPFDKSLTTTPAGGLSIYGYVNGNKNFGFWAQLDDNTMKLDPSGAGYPRMNDEFYKNPHPTPLDQSSASYYLTPSDISNLEKEGFTKSITFEQIKKYFEEKAK